jgi:hypothetical protein
MSITIELRLINLLVNRTVKAKVAAQEEVEVHLMKEARQILHLKREVQKNIAELVVQRRALKYYLNNISLFYSKDQPMGRQQIHQCQSHVLRLLLL